LIFWNWTIQDKILADRFEGLSEAIPIARNEKYKISPDTKIMAMVEFSAL
jgi:hypothetical protein